MISPLVPNRAIAAPARRDDANNFVPVTRATLSVTQFEKLADVPVRSSSDLRRPGKRWRRSWESVVRNRTGLRWNAIAARDYNEHCSIQGRSCYGKIAIRFSIVCS